MAKTNIQTSLVTIPEHMQGFLKPMRFKVAYGGRGGCKTYTMAMLLVVLGTHERLRILCTREVQTSIKDSVYRELVDQIHRLKLGPINEGGCGFYEVGHETITGANGTQFIFKGLRGNLNSIKSTAHCDIVWCEEAENISKESWDILIPTMRDGVSYNDNHPTHQDSEIWISFNPKYPDDETYKRFVLNPRPDSIVVKTNYDDNPWLPNVLKKEAEECKAKSMDDFEHIWLGKCRNLVEGSVYGSEVRDAEANGQVMSVPYDSKCEVHTFWDIGIADKTAIWVVQRVGFEFHMIDYIEGRGNNLDFYLRILANREYPVDRFYLPHDARARAFGTGMSIEETLRSKGKKVTIVPKLTVADGINAVRSIFPTLYFDSKRCAVGLHALRNYHYEIRRDRFGGFSNEPVHDDNSHASDSLRYCAVAFKKPKEVQEPKYAGNWRAFAPRTSTGWMDL